MKELLQSEYSKPESFENLVRLAAIICGTRAALINYIDHQSQWTLVNVGWENKQIPKKDSICQITIEDNELLHIPNTDKDKRLKKIEAVQKDPNIKFYAGLSFKSIDGMTGTLCVIDDRPRKLTDMQKDALKTLTSEVEARLNLISQKHRIQKQKKELLKKRQFLKNSLDIMLVLDPDTLVIEEVHTEIEGKFGYTPQTLEGTRFTEYLRSSDFADRIRERQKKNELDIFNLEVSFRTESGEPVCLMLNTSLAEGKLYVTGRDITKRKATDQLLLKEKNLSDGIIENLPGIFCLINKDGSVQRLNKNLKSVTEYDNDEIENNYFSKFLSQNEFDHATSKLKEIFDQGSARAELTIISKSGKQIPFLFTGFRHEVENEEFAVLLGINISEEKSALIEIESKEKNLQKAYQRLKNAQHIAKIGSWEWDVQSDELFWSDETYKILQFDKEEHTPSLDLLFDRLPPRAKERMEFTIQSVMNGGELQDLEHDVILPDGKRIHVYERGEAIFNNDGKVVKMIGSIQDVTEQKNIELELKMALDEKEVMMMEIHHRVKNNLAVISGLLQLETGFRSDSDANSSLLKSISRIKTMAAIHEHLYKSKNFSNICFDTYISELVEIIEDLYQDQLKDIKVHIHTDKINLNINQAIPCGLILSELISNSYKHAFKDRKEGQIDIKVSLQGDEVEIIVKDNGVGIDENIDPEKSSSLGFTLLEILSKQLHAEYNITGNEGTRTRLLFNKELNKRGSSGNVFA